ncbi:hypothetical protein HWV62_29670 [Athelia sp. TMB]|nr:hypothetical protein HWV62_29670 [Athelia sp. TMB]
MHRCGFCLKSLSTQASVKLHIANTPACRQRWDKEISRQDQKAAASVAPTAEASVSLDLPHHDNFDIPPNDFDYEPPHREKRAYVPELEGPQSKRVRMEEVADEDAPGRYPVSYPGSAAEACGLGKTAFEHICDEHIQMGHGDNPWAPFEDDDEWGLAEWLTKRVNKTATDEYLKLPITRKRTKPSYTSNHTFQKKLNQLPTGPGWTCEIITSTGDCIGPDNKRVTERHELWRRDPVECIRELIGNPAFEGCISYVPEMVYLDSEGKSRVYDEMWTGDWWWKMQTRLPSGAVVAPVILASDKTTLTRFRGDKSAWAVYLTIGNIRKDVRRQPSKHATVLIGYLPISKMQHIKGDEAQQLARYRLFHNSMRLLLKPLIAAGQQGVEMHDYPLRDPAEAWETLQKHRDGRDPHLFDDHGMRAVHYPFWVDLPHSDIFSCITPDVLHQLHKGVFKEHMMSWCTAILSEKELDSRFQAMSDYQGLRHFSRGISSISQWTGTEHKEMQRVFLSVIAGAVDQRVFDAARAVLDFIYYAQYHSHTDTTLTQMQLALDTFHANKHVFVELGIREDFNIPKIHSMLHYIQSIRLLGSADGYNSESPERLHIDYAKDAYDASSKVDYISQMTKWLSIQEAVYRHTVFVDWLLFQEDSPPIDWDNVEDDADDEEPEFEDHRHIGESLSQFISSGLAPGHGYRVAKSPPFPNTSIPHLIKAFGTADFVSALQLFLNNNMPSTAPRASTHDRPEVYKSVLVLLPPQHHISNLKQLNKIRAHPTIPSRDPRKEPSPAHFDTALIVEDREAWQAGVGLSGVRAAQIRAVFKLPTQYGHFPHPLAYIEWFRPFSTIDSNSGFFRVTRSTRLLRRFAAVVSVDSILQACHLAPRFGASPVPSTWTLQPAMLVNPCAVVFVLNHMSPAQIVTLAVSTQLGSALERSGATPSSGGDVLARHALRSDVALDGLDGMRSGHGGVRKRGA